MSSTAILNLDSDTAKNCIGSETSAFLTITNNGTGSGLVVDKLVCTSSATITAGQLVVTGAIKAANATVSAMRINTASVASGALIAFGGNALVSCATILFVSGGAAGTKALRIVNSDGTFGWIPVLPDAAVTGLAL